MSFASLEISKLVRDVLLYNFDELEIRESYNL
jgi:hypothetical protein